MSNFQVRLMKTWVLEDIILYKDTNKQLQRSESIFKSKHNYNNKQVVKYIYKYLRAYPLI